MAPEVDIPTLKELLTQVEQLKKENDRLNVLIQDLMDGYQLHSDTAIHYTSDVPSPFGSD